MKKEKPDEEGIKPIKRIQQFANVSGISIDKMESLAGLKKNVLQTAINRNSHMSDKTLAKIMIAFPNLNLKWVLLEKGRMLVSDSVEPSANIGNDPDFSDVLQLIKLIGNKAIEEPLKDKVFQLYGINSKLKSELLRVYKLTGDL